MAEVVLFHHAQGLTPGVAAFADQLRHAGHIVHTPDLFDGRTFDSIEKGMSFVKELGFGEVMARGERAVEGLPAELVYAGFSLGVVPAQKLAQTRPGARGALFFYSCVPVSEFGQLGRRGCRFRYMAWMPIRSLLVRATSTPLGHSSKKPKMGNSFSTPATSTTLRTARFLRTMRRHPRSCCSGY